MFDLSIIVPVYNVEKYIRECLESILLQISDDDSIEVVIINDGSTDNSWSIVSDIIKKFPSVKIVSLEQENKGISVARNTGLSACNGKYIFFIDSDDVLQPSTLEKLMPVLLTNSDIIEVDAFKFENVLSNKTELMDLLSFNNVAEIKESKQLRAVFEKSKWFLWSRIFKKSLLNEMVFSVGRRYEDVAITPYLYMRAKKIYPLKHYAIGYRQIQSSITKKIIKQDINDVIFSMRKILAIIEMSPEDNEMKKNVSLSIVKTFQYLKFLNNEVYGSFHVDKNTLQLAKDIKKIVDVRDHKLKFLATLYYPRLSGVYSYIKKRV